MKKLLIKNIKSLLQVNANNTNAIRGLEMQYLSSIDNAYLAIENDSIVDYGRMEDWEGISDWRNLEVIDAEHKYVMPAFCDSHSHVVFAGTREQEFLQRLQGLSYQQIASNGGGILNSAKKLAQYPEQDLYDDAKERILQLIIQGTGALEIKSGYGLSLQAELKMLRVINRLKNDLSIPIKATFLGAHAIPENFIGNKQGYVSHLINEMIPNIAQEKLADFCDVFCEEGYFDYDDTIKILQAAQQYGMKSKVHANQLSCSGGVQAGIKVNGVSVDHLEFLTDVEIALLKSSEVIATILPGAQYFLKLPNPPVREMLQANIPIAIASDYNPGSSPNGNMWWMLQHASIHYGMLPHEVINASTINGAFAMELQTKVGSIDIGKKANFIITKQLQSLTYMCYGFGVNYTGEVYINGKKQ